jgi:release factor glutamine methyltransferase
MSSARKLLQWAEQVLINVSSDAALDSLVLLSEAIGVSRTQVLFQDEITLEQETKFRAWVNQRTNGEPIQYITGRAYFRYLTLEVGPGVLIPRPESEEIVGGVIAVISQLAQPRVVDLGAGSGALALSIATEVPQSRVTAVEKESAALFWLERNVKRIGATLEGELTITHSDVVNFDGANLFDAVIANPPYIPDGAELPHEVAGFEPHVALYGGSAGVQAPKVFIAAALRALKPGGFFALEHHESHGEVIGELLERSFDQVKLHYDFNGRPRWSSGVRK